MGVVMQMAAGSVVNTVLSSANNFPSVKPVRNVSTELVVSNVDILLVLLIAFVVIEILLAIAIWFIIERD